MMNGVVLALLLVAVAFVSANSIVRDNYSKDEEEAHETQPLVSSVDQKDRNIKDEEEDHEVQPFVSAVDQNVLPEMKSSRAIFSVKQTAELPGNANAWEILRFDTVLVNRPAGSYNSETGKFTAPVAGLYVFTFEGTSGRKKNILLHLYKDDKQIFRAEEIGENIYTNVGMSTILFLEQNSEVYIWWASFESDGILTDGASFTGFFLEA